MPSGLAMIVYPLVSLLTFIAEEIVSGLTLVTKDRAQWFGVDSLLAYVCVDIDS